MTTAVVEAGMAATMPFDRTQRYVPASILCHKMPCHMGQRKDDLCCFKFLVTWETFPDETWETVYTLAHLDIFRNYVDTNLHSLVSSIDTSFVWIKCRYEPIANIWKFCFAANLIIQDRSNSMAASLINDDDVYNTVLDTCLKGGKEKVYYDFSGNIYDVANVGSVDNTMCTKVIRWFKPEIRQHRHEKCGTDTLLNRIDEKAVATLEETIITTMYAETNLGKCVHMINSSGIGYKWVKVPNPNKIAFSFKQVYDSFIFRKEKMLLVAYHYIRGSNHCINIDCSTRTILDSDNTHPLPFMFTTFEDFEGILKVHFKTPVESYVVFCVYELRQDTKQYVK